MIVDAHTHIFPPAMIERRDQLAAADPAFAALYADPDARMATAEELLESMQRAGVDASVAAGFWWGDPALAEEHAAYLLDAAAHHPDRLLPFLPQLEPDSRASGIGEVRAVDPVPLAAVPSPLLVHCSEPVGHAYAGKDGGLEPGALWRLVEARAEDAPPVLAAHWGGGFPFYALMPEVHTAIEAGRLRFDTAASAYLYDPAAFMRAIDLVGASAILWGSDYPLREQTRDLEDTRAALVTAGEGDRDAILGGNAARLFGLDASADA